MELPVVSIDFLPESLESFVNLRNTLCDTPAGAAAAVILALLLYARDDELGRRCMAAAVHHEQLWEGSEGYQGLQISPGNMQLIRAQIADRAYIMQSYIKGAAPENGYRLPDPPYLLEFTTNKYSGDPEQGRYKLFAVCSGAASPRPVTVKKDRDGLWKASEWSSLIVGVIPPKT